MGVASVCFVGMRSWITMARSRGLSAGRRLDECEARRESRLSARASFAAIGTTSLLLWLAILAVFQLFAR